MSIIRCPECGHEVSDKAPQCPSCGVEIAGKVTKCQHCGNIYFSNLTECPECHSHQHTPSTQLVAGGANGTPASVANGPHDNQKKPKRVWPWVIAAIIVIAIGAAAYWYNGMQASRAEAEEYSYALSSNDSTILRNYIDNYPDAPADHLDAIRQKLAQLQQADVEWTNAVVSGSKSALQQYLANHPDSPYKDAAMRKIDSLDWNMAQTANTIEAYETYKRDQPNGEHMDEADEAIRALNTKTVQPEEETLVASIFRSFFQSLSKRDADALSATVNSLLTSFLGKADANRADVVTFMNKIYKGDVAGMDWRIDGGFNISKKEVGIDEYEYTVGFSVVQDVEHANAATTNQKYKVKAKLNPDGKITEFNMVKIIE